MAGKRPLPLLLLLLLDPSSGGGASATAAAPAAATPSVRPYAPECPCMSPGSPRFEELADRLRGMGRPGYGLQGCRQYDIGLDWSAGKMAVQCSGHRPGDLGKDHCFNHWCFVDATQCRTNATLCPRQGSSDNLWCRDRPKFYSLVPGLGDFVYSYQTCGDLDSWSHAKSGHPYFPAMLDRKVLRIAPLVTPPLVLKQRGVFSGSLYEFFRSAVQLFPEVEIEIADPLISAQSQAEINGSLWTACVHDVGIGRLDACVGDYWVTSERLQMATFLPAIYEEAQYFLVKPKTGETMEDVLAKPFRPFTPELWFFIVAFLLLAGFMLALAERRHNGDDYPPEEPPSWHMARTVYYSVHAFVAGPVHTPATSAGKLITLGLSFFVLIAVASYTANLASFLLADTQQMSVQSFQEAVDQGYRICIHDALASRLRKTFPKLEARPGRVVSPVYSNQCAGLLHQGRVEGIVLSQLAMDQMYAGQFVEEDCRDPRNEGTALCPRDDLGEPELTRDCGIVRVGDAPLRVSISFPVDMSVQHGLGWAVIKQVADGALQSFELDFAPKSLAAKNACPKANSSLSTQSLSFMGLMGTMFISFALVILGSLLACANHTLRWWRAMHESPIAQEIEKELEEAEHDLEKKASHMSEVAQRIKVDLALSKRSGDLEKLAKDLQEAVEAKKGDGDAPPGGDEHDPPDEEAEQGWPQDGQPSPPADRAEGA